MFRQFQRKGQTFTLADLPTLHSIGFCQEIPRFRHIPSDATSQGGEKSSSEVNILLLYFALRAAAVACHNLRRQVQPSEVNRS